MLHQYCKLIKWSGSDSQYRLSKVAKYLQDFGETYSSIILPTIQAVVKYDKILAADELFKSLVEAYEAKMSIDPWLAKLDPLQVGHKRQLVNIHKFTCP